MLKSKKKHNYKLRNLIPTHPRCILESIERRKMIKFKLSEIEASRRKFFVNIPSL